METLINASNIINSTNDSEVIHWLMDIQGRTRNNSVIRYSAYSAGVNPPKRYLLKNRYLWLSSQ